MDLWKTSIERTSRNKKKLRIFITGTHSSEFDANPFFCVFCFRPIQKSCNKK